MNEKIFVRNLWVLNSAVLVGLLIQFNSQRFHQYIDYLISMFF